MSDKITVRQTRDYGHKPWAEITMPHAWVLPELEPFIPARSISARTVSTEQTASSLAHAMQQACNRVDEAALLVLGPHAIDQYKAAIEELLRIANGPTLP